MERTLLDFLSRSESGKIVIRGEALELRRLTAAETLSARREAAAMPQEEGEGALLSNACLAARCLYLDGQQVFPDGDAALRELSAEEILAVAQKYAETAVHTETGPLKKALGTPGTSASNGACSEPSQPFRLRREPLK